VSRFLAETFVAPRPILHNSKSYCWLVVCIHGGLIYCDVYSILLGSICKFLNDSESRTNRGLGFVSLYAYSSVLFGSTQKGLGFVMIRIVVFTLLCSRITVRVGRLASHRIFSVRQIMNSLRANFNPLLCVGSGFFKDCL
jgi:hypothetical protein